MTEKSVKPLPNGYPWGTATASGTNPYEQSPDTGVIRYYDFTVQRGKIAPDGYLKNVLLVNGQYPGVSGFLQSLDVQSH